MWLTRGALAITSACSLGRISYDLLLRHPGSRRPRHDRRYPHQCGARQYFSVSQAAGLFQPGRAHHGDRRLRQPVAHPIGRLNRDRGLGEPGDRRARDPDERAHHVQGGATHRARDPHAARHRGRGAGSVRGQVRPRVPVRRPDQGREAAAVHDLRRRQFHRVHGRYALPADRRAQIWQAGARPRHSPTTSTSTTRSRSD